MPEDRAGQTASAAHEWSLGRAEAPVTMLEYADFECPDCGVAHRVLESLVTDYPERVRLVFRNFPVATSHPNATAAAEAAEAAGAQGRFWPMHDLLFTHQQALEPGDLRGHARTLGLDMDRFDREMAGHVHLAKVRADFHQGVLDGVNGTPTIFLNGQRFDGMHEAPHLLAAIARLP